LAGVTRRGNIRSLERHAANCLERKKAIGAILTKEFLTEHLIRKQESANYIAKTVLSGALPPLQFGADLIISFAKKYGVPTRNVKESNGTAHVICQRSITCRKRYGVRNPSQAEHVKEKKRQKAMEVYGCENVFQADAIKEKSRRTCIVRYGMPSYTQTREYAQKQGLRSKRSSHHRWVESYLKRLGASVESECSDRCGAFNDELGRFMCPRPDMIVGERVVMEVYGDLWHANPKMYQYNDLIPVWGGPCSAQEIWQYDSIRQRHLEKLGFEVHVFWESEINNQRKDVRTRIKEILREHNWNTFDQKTSSSGQI